MTKSNILYFKQIPQILVFIFLFDISSTKVQAQVPAKFSNQAFLNALNENSDYQNRKTQFVKKYSNYRSGRWGEFVKGVCENLKTSEKVIALTFDACGGEKGSGFDKELVEFLRKEKIPATIFVTGRWIDSHYSEFLELAKDPLFEIENHGLNHKPCTIAGRSVYGIKGTANASEAYDEVEGNARKIEAITGRRPHYYRSATAFIDEAGASLVHDMEMTPVSYQVLSGDASPTVSKANITNSVLSKIRPGAIVIMHINHPQWNTREALLKIVPELKKEGYRFAHLNQYQLIGRNGNT
jgi:peptidoglycan/xylan/chitin deacetylase (PgdA/CDA1 family)